MPVLPGLMLHTAQHCSKRISPKFFLVGLLMTGLFSGCEDNQPAPNQPPDTRLFVDTIKLSGENRLKSTVTLKWSGTDQDGFVKGYEYRFADRDWQFVTTTDSTFRFLVKQGDQTRNINFKVRAIDNKEAVDPSPASLTVPVKNSAPQVKWDSEIPGADTAFTVMPLAWSVSDPDGNKSLDSAFIRANQGPWIPVSRFVELVTIVPENPRSNSSSTAQLYKGLEAGQQLGKLPNLNLAGNNTFYLKATDIAGATSAIDTLGPIYLKSQQSDLLVLAASNNSFPDPRGVYKPLIRQVYGNFDYIDIFARDQQYFPQFWNAAFAKRLNLYDKVFLFADDKTINQELVLESASAGLQRYLNQGGHLFITATFPNDLRSSSTVFSYSPMDSIPQRDVQQRLPTDSIIKPVARAENTFKPLKASSFIIGVDAFSMKATAKPLYKGDFPKVSGKAYNTLIATSNGSDQEVNQVFSAVPLHKLNQKPANLKAFFDAVLNKKFK